MFNEYAKSVPPEAVSPQTETARNAVQTAAGRYIHIA